MKSVWNTLLKIATWGLGHAPAIAAIAVDAANKNIPGVIRDAVVLAGQTAVEPPTTPSK